MARGVMLKGVGIEVVYPTFDVAGVHDHLDGAEHVAFS
jgi:hypothetical protein